MPDVVRIGPKSVGPGQPVFIIAEIGINHNGDLELAKRLIDLALEAGCDAVKFQKRTPELCVPDAYRNVVRETPWGLMSYLDYRRRVEFGRDEYREIDRYCHQKGILWFASCWDTESVDFMAQFDTPCFKVASACLTDHELLAKVRQTGKPVVLSTGMSTMEEVDQAVEGLGRERLVITHCTSTYPCPPEELNLRMIQTLRQRFECPVGYSGHEVGLSPTLAAVVLGACLVERHITLDRAMWGSDQAASVERQGMIRLVRDIRQIEIALGDGVKRIYPSEAQARQRLRKSENPEPAC
ncbi:MAG: N-acetylneuraminate synthase family protein [Desulfarculus sp.]|nr:N-acetylneuraminate synthase family protein [Desulfarculus sp.]